MSQPCLIGFEGSAKVSVDPVNVVQRLLAGMLRQAKGLLDAPRLRLLFNWSADLESDKTSTTPFPWIKIAAFLRMDFPVCCTHELDHALLLWAKETLYSFPRPDLICQDIEALLVCHETYCHPLINVNVVSAVRLGVCQQIGGREMDGAIHSGKLIYAAAPLEVGQKLISLFSTPFMRTTLLLTALCTCFDIAPEDRGRIWTSSFSLLHHLYLANDANVLK